VKDSLSERINTLVLKSLYLTKPRFMSFWNGPEVKRLCKFIGRAFLVWLAALCTNNYVSRLRLVSPTERSCRILRL